MPANSFYNSSGVPVNGAGAYSSVIRSEFALIGAAFQLLPSTPFTSGGLLRFNDTGTALIVDSNWSFDNSTGTVALKNGGNTQPMAQITNATTGTAGNNVTNYASARINQGNLVVNLTAGTITVNTPGLYWVTFRVDSPLSAGYSTFFIAKNGAFSYTAFAEISLGFARRSFAGSIFTAAAGDVFSIFIGNLGTGPWTVWEFCVELML